MELMILILGVCLSVFGLVNIFLRWKCYEMEAVSWMTFLGGAFITVLGFFTEGLVIE